MTVVVVDESPDPAVFKRVICRNCGARLEYVPNDVRSQFVADYSGSYDERRWVDCPKCTKRAYI